MGEIFLTTALAAAPAEAFDLSLDVEFHLRSMVGAGEQIVGGTRSGRMGLGDEVTWRARHAGLWWRMTSRITDLERPHRFVDEQVTGPFASFRHVHCYSATPDGCVMTDDVTFSAPCGPLGTAVDRLFLVRYLRALIEGRNRTLVAELT